MELDILLFALSYVALLEHLVIGFNGLNVLACCSTAISLTLANLLIMADRLAALFNPMVSLCIVAFRIPFNDQHPGSDFLYFDSWFMVDVIISVLLHVPGEILMSAFRLHSLYEPANMCC